jgi:hypothetical protein
MGKATFVDCWACSGTGIEPIADDAEDEDAIEVSCAECGGDSCSMALSASARMSASIGLSRGPALASKDVEVQADHL